MDGFDAHAGDSAAGIGILRHVTAPAIAVNLDHPLAPWWVSMLWDASRAGRATWADTPEPSSQSSRHAAVRAGVLRVTRDPAATTFFDAGPSSKCAATVWLGASTGAHELVAPRAEPLGSVAGVGQGGSSDSYAGAHVQAVVRTVGLWARRFELRWLMVELAVGTGSVPDPTGEIGLAGAHLEAKTIERAVASAYPDLAGKVSVRVRSAPFPVAQLDLHGSFAGAPGEERLRTSLRDACASPGWAAHIELARPPAFGPAHTLDRPRVAVVDPALRALGPLGALRAWYDPCALLAARSFELALA